MNNKHLIPLVLFMLTGCATNKPITVSSGTGGGAAGSQYSIENNKTSSLSTGALTVSSSSSAANNATAITSSTSNDDKNAYSSVNRLNSNASSTQSSDTQSEIETEIVKEDETKVIASYESNNHIAMITPPVYPSIDKEPSIKNTEDDKVETQEFSETNPVFNQTKPEKSPTESADSLSKILNKRYSNKSHSSSAGNPSSYVISGENYKVLPFSHGFVERGIASWYGPDFHGEKTSNGEIYDMYGMTAAHKRLPIPSYVKVTNLKNKRSVILRINDRGPFYADRVIDLSYSAAQKLDIHQPGTEMVQIEAINTPMKESVYIQLGVFSNPLNAQLLQKKVVQNKMPQPEVKEVLVAGKIAYRVQLGPIFSVDKVNEFNAKLAKIGIAETWYLTDSKI